MKALSTIVVDDEPLVRERIAALVREDAGLQLVGEATHGLEALDLINRLAPDLVFIDVEMPELSGFGVIAALDEKRVPGIIFVTAYEQYAVGAFDAGAIDYLHKPVTRQRFVLAVTRAKERLQQRTIADARALIAGAAHVERGRGTRTRFLVRRGATHYFVPVADVDWMDVADNYVRLHVGDRVHLARATLTQVEQELDPERFARIHRSLIVALDRITTVRSHLSGGYVVELAGGVRLRCSRQYAGRVRDLVRGRA
jgi:two-component system LytT family response regulator